MKSSGVYDQKKLLSILGIGLFVLATILLIFFVARTGSDDGGDSITMGFDPIDSSSCVACHTSEAVIAASTWGDDQEEAEDTGG